MQAALSFVSCRISNPNIYSFVKVIERNFINAKSNWFTYLANVCYSNGHRKAWADTLIKKSVGKSQLEPEKVLREKHIFSNLGFAIV